MAHGRKELRLRHIGRFGGFLRTLQELVGRVRFLVVLDPSRRRLFLARVKTRNKIWSLRNKTNLLSAASGTATEQSDKRGGHRNRASPTGSRQGSRTHRPTSTMKNAATVIEPRQQVRRRWSPVYWQSPGQMVTSSRQPNRRPETAAFHSSRLSALSICGASALSRRSIFAQSISPDRPERADDSSNGTRQYSARIDSDITITTTAATEQHASGEFAELRKKLAPNSIVDRDSLCHSSAYLEATIDCRA